MSRIQPAVALQIWPVEEWVMVKWPGLCHNGHREEQGGQSNMEEHSSIGKRIAWLRKERGLTQDQLAERVGVTAQAVSK